MSQPDISELEDVLAAIGSQYAFADSARSAKCRECAGDVELSDAQRYGEEPVPPRCAKCTAVRARERRLAACVESVPPAYAWARLGAPELAARVRAKVPTDGGLVQVSRAPRVVFLGPAGSGKTSLAVALLREMVARERWGLFAHAYKLAAARGRQKLGTGESPIVARALDTELLLVDDVGNERRTELSALPDVIFERHAEERRTWVTTAFDEAGIAGLYGDGIARRIFERALVIRTGGAS
jgi:hypothetical protein